MGKYTETYSDIYSVFAAPEWAAEAIKTIPESYSTTGLGNEWIRVSIVTGSTPVFLATSLSGQLIIDIYVPAGEGLSRLTAIADKLDTYLVRRSVAAGANGTTQFGSSTLVPLGADAANASLYRGSYSINFNYFRK